MSEISAVQATLTGGNDDSQQADELFEKSDDAQPVPPSDVVAYNELRSCADLVRMYSTGKLEIQPDFQRDVVWGQEEQARFIDSLVKQLPIPSMCFSLDYKSQKWKVIDGLQRMSSIIRFLGKESWSIEAQSDIDPRLCGVTNVKLREGSEDQRRIYSQVEEVSIPITVIRCDYSQNSHMRYLFTIFYRLNLGGVRLTNQEIRNCIYSGAFNDMLKKFDKVNADWQMVKTRIWGGMDRFRSVEVLLRVLAFSSSYKSYDGNMAGFLNNYMHQNMHSGEAQTATKEQSLARAIAATKIALSQMSAGKRSLTLIEALLVGFIGRTTDLRADEIETRVGALLQDSNFSEASKYAIGSEQNVKRRLQKAVEILTE